MKTTRLVVTALLVLSVGCENLPTGFRLPSALPGSSASQPERPSPAAASEIDASSLIDARLQIPPIPRPPSPPKTETVDAAKYVNRKGSFRGTSTGLLTKSDLVAVMGGLDLVGADSSAGKYVGDLLNAALQGKQIPLVDRDYRVVKRDEANSLLKTNSSLYERFIVLNQNEAVNVLRESRAVTHVVIVHSVVVPNNPLTIQLPREIKPEEWNQYERKRDEYSTKVPAYNNAVVAYTKAMSEWAKANWKSNPRLVDKAIEGSSGNQSVDYASLRDWVELQPRVRTHYSQPLENQENPQDLQRILSNAGNDPSALLQLQRLSNYRRSMATSGPTTVEIDPTFVYGSAEQALAATVNQFAQPWVPVQAFQAAISVRVIELKSSKAVWFGFASAQNLSYAEAMSDAVEAIAEHVVDRERR